MRRQYFKRVDTDLNKMREYFWPVTNIFVCYWVDFRVIVENKIEKIFRFNNINLVF